MRARDGGERKRTGGSTWGADGAPRAVRIATGKRLDLELDGPAAFTSVGLSRGTGRFLPLARVDGHKRGPQAD